MNNKDYECDICHKTFSRKDNLARHQKRHSNSSEHECSDCGKVFKRKANLQTHMKNKHTASATKRSRSEEPEPPAKRLKEDVAEHYTLRKIGESRMKKFRSIKTTYKVNFKDVHVTGLKEILITLKKMFGSLIHQVTKEANDSDLIRISVQNPELDYPIIIPFTRKDQLTVERLLSEIERVLQSYEEFVLDKEIELDIVHVQNPKAGGKKTCKLVNLNLSFTRKEMYGPNQKYG